MKKTLLALSLFIILTGCTTSNEQSDFKTEYEELNNKETEYNTKYKELNIPEDNLIDIVTYDELKEVLNEGTGVVYFGFPECPWCRASIVTFIEVCKEKGIDTIYYYNPKDIRDTMHLDDDGKIVVDKKATKEYKELLTYMDSVLTPYEGLNDPSIKRLYAPTYLAFKDGKAIDIHVSTVESQSDPYKELTKEQEKELKKAFSDLIDKTTNACNSSC